MPKLVYRDEDDTTNPHHDHQIRWNPTRAHTSHAGLGLPFGRRLLCALGERVADDLLFALLDRNITAFTA